MVLESVLGKHHSTNIGSVAPRSSKWGAASNEVILCDFYTVPSDPRRPKNSRGNCCRNRSVESHICLSFCGITNVHSKDVIALLHHEEAPSVSKGQFEIFGQRHQCLRLLSLSASVRARSCRRRHTSSESLARKRSARKHIESATDDYRIAVPCRGAWTSFPITESLRFIRLPKLCRSRRLCRLRVIPVPVREQLYCEAPTN